MPEKLAGQSARSFVIGVVIVLAFASVVAFLLIIVAALEGSFTQAVLDGLTILLYLEAAILIICGPLVAVCTYCLWKNARDHLVRVRARDGRLSVWIGAEQREFVFGQCRWSPGRLGEMRLFTQYRIFSTLPVVLIRLPGGSFFGRPPLTIGVGYTAEMHKKWKALFILAGVPRSRSRIE